MLFSWVFRDVLVQVTLSRWNMRKDSLTNIPGLNVRQTHCAVVDNKQDCTVPYWAGIVFYYSNICEVYRFVNVECQLIDFIE